MRTILHINNLTMNFGGICAVSRADMDIREGEIVALIGPNGAGKTTLFNCVTGVYEPTYGDIYFEPPGRGRKRLNGLKINHITELGIARTFQNIRLFQNMTVLENVMIGRHCRAKSGIIGAILRDRETMAEEERILADSYHVLEKIGLADYCNELAKNLPYGAQRRLEIARALATDPFLLLLDEPAAGMNPQETKTLDELIVQIRDQEKISVLLIEHDMKLVMSISDRIFVMDHGEMISQGTPEEVRRDEKVIKAYLGEEIA